MKKDVILNEDILWVGKIKEDFTLYYKLIIHPHRKYVQDMLKKIKDLKINTIAPSHGFIIRLVKLT